MKFGGMGFIHYYDDLLDLPTLRMYMGSQDVIVMTWHTINPIAEDIYQISEPIGTIEPRFGVSTVNMYLVVGRERAALIDGGMGIGDVSLKIAKITSLPCMVLNTHYHWDHVGANASFKERAIHEIEIDLVAQKQNVASLRKVMKSPAARAALPPGFDPSMYRIVPKPATHILHDNDRIDLGSHVLKVLHTPGHSPGHVTFWHEANNMLFTGDTASMGPVYACFEGSDPEALAKSVKRLAALTNVQTICPGHEEIITSQGWLCEMAECVEAAMAGKVPGQLHQDFIVGQEFRFDTLSVWLPLRDEKE
jgi:glyoxylase-like metal-dependent hydrolase (beta-lactamase superfamily II)